MKCPLCGCEEINPSYRDMYRCSNCNLFIKKDTLGKEDLKKQLRNFLLSACHNETTFKRRIKNANYQLDNLEKHIKPGKVYDVGCAGGFFMKAAKDRGWVVEGNDISKAAAEYAKKVFDFNIDYEFFEDVVLEKESYDAVVMWNTLEHTHDPAQTVMHAHDALKKGGLLYIKVPEMPTVSLLSTYYEPYHFYEFNVKNLSNFLIRSGFKELHTEKSWKRDEISVTEYLFQKEV